LARYRFRDGTKALIDAMLADGKVPVRLATPVASVEQHGARVVVASRAGEEWSARAVISTLPLNVLRDVAWSPGLDARKLELSAQRHAGVSTKVHVLVEGEHNVACLAPSESPLNWLFTDHVGHGRTHLVGFGPGSDRLDVGDAAQVANTVQRMLPNASIARWPRCRHPPAAFCSRARIGRTAGAASSTAPSSRGSRRLARCARCSPKRREPQFLRELAV
jgi:hypothetical protein